jgi:hypothetical protein
LWASFEPEKSSKKNILTHKMPLFEAKPIDENEVKELVKEHWALDLGKCLKAFQNHVFLALRQDDTKFIVRVTPDIDGTRKNDTEVELALLDYLHANNLPVCKVKNFHTISHSTKCESSDYFLVGSYTNQAVLGYRQIISNDHLRIRIRQRRSRYHPRYFSLTSKLSSPNGNG